jgi:Tfp pilus assembly protein PilF
MADISFNEGDNDATKLYLDRYHLVARASPKSLWLSIRNTLELDGQADVTEFGERLENEFPNSPEYQEWLKIQ